MEIIMVPNKDGGPSIAFAEYADENRARHAKNILSHAHDDNIAMVAGGYVKVCLMSWELLLLMYSSLAIVHR